MPLSTVADQWKGYLRKFGDPSKKENKSRGHVVKVVGGKKGVLVPKVEDPDAPMEFIQEEGAAVEEDKEEDVGSSDGDEDLADSKFAHMAKEANAEYARAAEGQMASLLSEISKEEGDKEIEKLKEKRVARRKKRQAAEKAGKVLVEKKKARSSFFMDADSSDDSSSGVKLAKKRKAAPGKNSKPAAKSTGVQDGEGGDGEADLAGDGEDKRRGARGAPKKDGLLMAQNLWTSFEKAEEGSLFFTDPKVSDVQKRLVIRWANDIRSKLEACKDAEKTVLLELAAKRLNIVEQCMKLYKGWRTRTENSRALCDFNEAFAILEAFVEGAPAQQITCGYIWELRIQIKARGVSLGLGRAVTWGMHVSSVGCWGPCSMKVVSDPNDLRSL